ncbi:MAG: Rrf2 family transcriptional regulator [Elusimicrobiota bacterium]|jgi:Rrf2 family protein
MVGVLNMSEAAVLALHVVWVLARKPGQAVTTSQAAAELRVSAAHLSKVLQRLVKAGIAQAVRGPKGGYSLGRKPSAIRLRDVFEAVEGPLNLSRCLMPEPRCGRKACLLGGLLGSINKQVVKELDKKVSDL